MATGVERALQILQGLKNGAVTNPTALKWVDAFWTVYGPGTDGNGDPIENPTNEQKAAFYVRTLREHHQRVMEQSRVPGAGIAAQEAEAADVATETGAELGTD